MLMLTGTLVSAQQINDRVVAINTTYPQVDKNLKSVPLALQTAQIAGQIRQAAEPLGPQAIKISHDVDAIQGSATSILNAAKQINTSVLSINGGVHSIHDAVIPIGTTLTAIDSDVQSINHSVHGINDNFGGILDTVHSIKYQVIAINNRADVIIDQVRQIKDNTGQLVSPLLPDVLKNSGAIARSPVLLYPKSLTAQNILKRVGPELEMLKNHPPGVELLQSHSATPDLAKAPEVVTSGGHSPHTDDPPSKHDDPVRSPAPSLSGLLAPR
ncbi:MAG: methyl-accepting chemotaxis protein [Pseudonocardia sp.]|nr:methyl-accepting chemotaxis protein [Pseudonocardia sp.]